MNFDLEKSISVLRRTPAVMRTLLEGQHKDWTHQNEGGDSWSPYDVVGHLVHGEKTDWLPRIRIILNEGDQKIFKPYDRFAQFEMSKGKSLDTLLAEFEALRASNIGQLQDLGLTDFDLEKEGIHPELGPVTMKNLIAAWLVHDMGHITQVSRVIAKQYKDEVGPWPKYLTILNSTPKE